MMYSQDQSVDVYQCQGTVEPSGFDSLAFNTSDGCAAVMPIADVSIAAGTFAASGSPSAGPVNTKQQRCGMAIAWPYRGNSSACRTISYVPLRLELQCLTPV